MKTAFRASFVRDLKRIKDETVLRRVRKSIDAVAIANSTENISNCKKLADSKHAFRIRIGEFRLGIIVVGDTVEFAQYLHRREIYRFFPE